MTEIKKYDRLTNINCLISHLEKEKLLYFDNSLLEILQTDEGISIKSKVNIKNGTTLVEMMKERTIYASKDFKNIDFDPFWRNWIMKNKTVLEKEIHTL